MARVGDERPPDEGPDPDAYGRVTHPERFAPLRDVATRLVTELAATYDVRVDVGTGSTTAVGGPSVDRVTRLVPHDPAAATIVVELTTFPGVTTAAGRWSAASFPSCGCDACDEDVDEAGAQLQDWLRAVVAGGLREELRRGTGCWQVTELAGDGWSSRSEERMTRQRYRQLGGRQQHDYAPWPPKARPANGV